MKNARSNVLRLFAVTLALSSAPTIAQTSSDVDQTVTLNNPEIKKVGKGVQRKGIFGKYAENTFVLRSSPIESEATVHLYRDYKNYDVLTCRTPCLFKIPGQASFKFNVATPPGYVQISEPPFVTWGVKDLIFAAIVPDDITYKFIPQ